MTTQTQKPPYQHPGYPVLLDLHYSKAIQYSIVPDLLCVEFKLDSEPTFATAYVQMHLLDLKRCTARASVHSGSSHDPPGHLIIVFPPNQDWGPHKFTATPEQVGYMDWSHTAPEAVERLATG